MVGLRAFWTSVTRRFAGEGRRQERPTTPAGQHRPANNRAARPPPPPARPTRQPTTAPAVNAAPTPKTLPAAASPAVARPTVSRRRPTALRSARPRGRTSKDAKAADDASAQPPSATTPGVDNEAATPVVSERTQARERTCAQRSRRRTRRRHSARRQRQTVVQLNADKFALSATMGQWCERTLKNGVRGLRADFERLRFHEPPRCTTEAFKDRRHKLLNRYKDVRLLDSTRVRLQGAHEYIHASYVNDMKKQRRFILTQGPLDESIAHFWAMVWQEQCETIVMVCDFVEAGKPKCADYVPLRRGETLVSGQMHVRNTRVTELLVEGGRRADVHRAELQLTRGSDEARAVTHWRWTGWPDRAVPLSTAAALFLCETALDCRDKPPPVVHCSAGIGRSGTLVAVALAMRTLRDGSLLDGASLLKHLRAHRLQSIQTETQYLFLHRCLLDYLVQHSALNDSKHLMQFKAEYDPLAAAAQPYV